MPTGGMYELLTLVLVAIVLIVSSSQTTTRHDEVALEADPNLPPSEMAALQDLYDSCNGPNWRKHILGNPWNFTATANPCTQHWQGVKCQLVEPYYHVLSMSMVFMNLAGTLPSSLVNLTHMVLFSVTVNHLNGTVPAFLGNMTNLEIIDLSTNRFTGTIPASFANLKGLKGLDVAVNYLTGTFPESIGSLTKLEAISVESNDLSGSIPSSLGQLSKLVALHCYKNQFTGTIPESLCNFTKLTTFDFSVNLLTGTIPGAIGNMTKMVSMFLFENDLTGTIPAFFADTPQLETFEMYDNYLTGTIPNVIGGASKMNILALYNNSLSGTIPDAIQNMTQLQYLYIDSNHFTGTIPPCVGNLSSLILVDLHSNHLEGTIPSFGVNSTRLKYLVLYDNMLTGAIPTSVTNLTALRQFQVQFNRLSGSLKGVFSPTSHGSLTTIQVNNNQLSGQLHKEIFLLPVLLIFSAVSNCFEGQLPHTVCDSSTVNTLVLDGLSSAKACRDTLLPGISRSYITQQSVYGTIPKCLFALDTLTTRHLSGNGFTGSLPSNLTIAEVLVDLTLSHNLLTGSIPQEFQARQWLNLDLSYNKFGGTLNTNFSTSKLNRTKLESYETSLGVNASTFHLVPSLLLANNRLSGHIPAAVRKEQNISILGTNVFSCKLDRSDLPAHDSGRENYQCGSDSFDVPYYVWLSLTLAVLCALLLAVTGARLSKVEMPIARRALEWMKVDVPMPNITAVQRILALFRDLALWISAYVLLVLLPLYCVLTHFYGTLTYQYAWGVSAAYLSGTMPVAWEFALWCTLLCVVLCLFMHMQRAKDPDVDVDASTDSSRASAFFKASVIAVPAPPKLVSAAKSSAIYALFISVNLMVVIGVNSAYVYVAIYRGSALLRLAQIIISLFKIAWNNVCTELILQQILKRCGADSTSTADSQFMSLQVFVALLNNIVIPCLVVAVISPDCFYDLFDAAPAVNSEFSYQSCVLDEKFVCYRFQMELVDTSYDPPFRYSYQCSSAFITYYAPAFVILCAMVTFVIPVLQMLTLYCHQRAKSESKWFKVLDTLLPRILKPISADPATVASTKPVLDQNRLYFDANRVLIIALTFLGLLLTFGAVFPPLAVAICLTVLSVVYWAKCKLGRFLTAAQEQQLQGYVEVIERECAQVGSSALLHNSMWMLLSVSCCFYTLFLFDTLGDAMGFDDALWVLIVMPLAPVVLYAGCVLLQWCLPPNGERVVVAESRSIASEAELIGVGQPSEASVDSTTLNILQHL